MKKQTSLIMLTLMVSLNIFAQIKSDSIPTKKHKWEIETDPIAFALNGYSAHGIYLYKRIRFDFGVFGISQPESYTGNKGFDVNSVGVGLKVNYLLNRRENWFAGVGTGYGKNQILHRESNQRQNQQIISWGVHTGYRLYLFKKIEKGKIYLTPWVSFDYNIPLNKVVFTQTTYKTNSFSIFPTIHLGYRFK